MPEDASGNSEVKSSQINSNQSERRGKNEWSGRRESNPRGQLGKLEHNHFATPASLVITGI